MTYNLCDYNTVSGLLKKYGFTFSKALGQNFLIDDSVCPAMAAELGADGHTAVIEIGPGIGVLTKELCEVAGKVIAIELDKRLYPVLGETLGDYDNFELVEGDAMKLDLAKLISEKCAGFESVKVCANLPYYITSPILMHLLESDVQLRSITVMVQKEAADRLCAEIGSRDAGAVTAAVRLRGHAEQLFEVPRTSFYPSPKVDSAVIRITPYETPLCTPEKLSRVLRIVKAGFAQRRKTAVNAIASGLALPKEQITEALAAVGQPANVRFEQLGAETLLALADAMQQGMA